MIPYRATLDYLFGLQRVGIKLGLENIRALLAAIGNPEKKFPAIHIAGTNGKGSTAAMLATVLQHGGYRVGLYTSPHLTDFRERIRINREMIAVRRVVNFTRRLRPLIEEIQPSFFEVTTAMAFWHFAEKKVDIAIVETGLGGRLDATNVLHPLATVITPVDMDHQNYLGNTIGEIAAEKAGIIKPGVICLTNNVNPRVLQVLEKKCRETGSQLVQVHTRGGYRIDEMHLSHSVGRLEYSGNIWHPLIVNLPGEHQWDNALLAIATLFSLSAEMPVSREAVVAGLKNLQWRARIHRVSQQPNVIIDASHNPAGFQKTLTFLHRFFPKEQIRAIVFLQSDKDYRKISEILVSHVKKVYAVDVKLGKPLQPEVLHREIIKSGGCAEVVANLDAAIEKIKIHKDDETLWLIIGSHYLAGAAYPYFC